MIGFGWSVSDLALAIKIIANIIQALDREKGAKNQYAKSCGFLRQLVPILGRIQEQVSTDAEEPTREDLAQHAQVIKTAYDDFEVYLHRKHKGLLPEQDATTVKQTLKKIQWSLDELHEKVQKLKSQINDAVHLYSVTLTQDIYEKVTDLKSECSSLRTTAEERDQHFRDLNIALEQLKQRTEVLDEAARDMQQALADEQLRAQGESKIAIRADIAEMRQDQSSKAEYEVMCRMQAQMLEGQKEVADIARRQYKLTQDESEARKWERLQTEAKEDVQRSEEACKTRDEEIQATTKALTDGLDGFSDLTGNKQIKTVAEKAGPLSKLLNALNIVGRPGGRDQSSPQQATGPPSQAPLRTAPAQSNYTAPRLMSDAPVYAPSQTSSRPLLPAPSPPLKPPPSKKTLADPYGLEARQSASAQSQWQLNRRDSVVN